MRVYELAKTLGITSKECMARLAERGVVVKNHANAVDEAVAATMLAPVPEAPPAAKQTAKPASPAKPKVQRAKAAPAAPPPPKPAARKAAPPRPPEKPARAKEPAPAPHPQKVADLPAPTLPAEKILRLKGAIVVRELAEELGMRPNAVIAELMGMNILANIAQKVEVNVARAIAEKHGFTVEHEKRAGQHPPVAPRKTQEDEEDEDRPEDLEPRPPVVTFMGHVDHGKTSLLDRIRQTSVVDDEFGGITQHIGAYTVNAQGRSITFLDTPGHAAFTAMRARGANLTDIAVIVIAADDGIMPQTREAIQHAQAAGVTVLIAINKIDLPAADLDRARRQLQSEDLAPEDWGGNTICCPVSAKTGEGLDHLLEMILLQAELLELKANPKRRAQGYVIEANLEPGMGPTANLLVTKGTLELGDVILCGAHCGRVRALINDHGSKVKSAEPSAPVKCLGLPGVPEAGAAFRVCANERLARSLAQERSQELKQKQLFTPRSTTFENLLTQMEGEKKQELRVVLKADTQGSIEALQHALAEIRSDKVSLRVLLAATGNVTENDVMLASASEGAVLGFCVGREPGVDAICKREGVEVRFHNIIYELVDKVRSAMLGLLAPEMRETVVGTADILQTFSVGKSSLVAGCRLTKGIVTPRHKVRVKRKDEVLYEGAISSLKHFQDSVAEVREPQECGIRIDRFSDFRAGDTLEFFEVNAVDQTL